MNELKEILFMACALEANKMKNMLPDKAATLVQYREAQAANNALYAVIRQAGPEDEYKEWLEG